MRPRPRPRPITVRPRPRPRPKKWSRDYVGLETLTSLYETISGADFGVTVETVDSV